MLHAIDNVVAGQITYAVRNTKVDDFNLKKGDIIGLDDKKILAKAATIKECAVELIKALKEKSHSVINLYYGSDISESDAEEVRDFVQEHFEDMDVELFNGGQAVYYFIVSLE